MPDMKLEERSKGLAVLSQCCESPFFYVRDGGKLTAVMQHSREPHMLVLSVEDVEQILEEMKRRRATIGPKRSAA